MKLRALAQKILPAASAQHMPGFDEIYYRYWYRDVARFSGPLLQHYLIYGWKEGRDPSAGFSSDGYLAANPDVRAEGCNPLAHFLDFGLAEGRKGWEKDPMAPAPLPRFVPDHRTQKLLAPPKSS